MSLSTVLTEGGGGEHYHKIYYAKGTHNVSEFAYLLHTSRSEICFHGFFHLFHILLFWVDNKNSLDVAPACREWRVLERVNRRTSEKEHIYTIICLPVLIIKSLMYSTPWREIVLELMPRLICLKSRVTPFARVCFSRTLKQ